jgi:dTMP kinase
VLGVGRLIVIEGLDGSGKRTLTDALSADWRAAGRSVATMAFPRYGIDVHADLVRDTLYGRLGDLADSVYGPALLFALDRRAAAAEIRELLANYDVLLLDRYVTSNAAYGSARLGGPAVQTGFADWVHELEIDRFGVPTPDLQILLATPVAMAAQRARGRAADDDDRALDAFEADAALQSRTGQMYAALAAGGYLSPWQVLTPAADGSLTIPPDLAG